MQSGRVVIVLSIMLALGLVSMFLFVACGPTPAPMQIPVAQTQDGVVPYPLQWVRVDSPVPQLETWVLTNNKGDYHCLLVFDGKTYAEDCFGDGR